MSPFMQDPLVGPLAATLGFSSTAVWFAVLAAAIWTLVWKALALWHAARNHQKAWFLILLIANTVGILEIVYLAFFRKDRNAPGETSLFGFKDVYRAGEKSSVPATK